MKTYGLIGRDISYSFSRSYFSRKFAEENIPARYLNFDLQDLSGFKKVLREQDNLAGMNVTIPYKEKIMAHLDELDPVAREIGAVNTIKIMKSGGLKGFNTDHYGFSESIRPFLQPQHSKALILGTGGASKAIAYALPGLGISYKLVSRSPGVGEFGYNDLTPEVLAEYKLIINCTPLGTFPKVEEFPPIPAAYLSPEHLLYDLIYNPEITALMRQALDRDATVVNGKRMLELQAEKAWEIWNS